MRIDVDQLKRQIELEGITGAELARRADLCQSTISNTRAKGSCDYVTLVKMASALRIDVSALIPGDILKKG